MTVTFNPVENIAVGTYPMSIAVGDFNDDNLLDIVSGNSNSLNISLLLGDGSGSFAPSDEFPVGHRPFSIAVGDINSDGFLDLVTANTDSSADNVSLLLGNGTGGFAVPDFLPIGNQPYSVALGDFNNDSNLDIATTKIGGSGDEVSVVLGDGTGNFAAPVNFTVGIRPESIALGDFNNDSNLDIVTANPNSTNVSLLLGDGSGSFAPSVNFALEYRPFAIAVGDINNDGKLDLATANSNSDNVSVLLGDGSGGFASPVSFTVGDSRSGPASVAIGDINGDGFIDLATANFVSDNVSVLVGDGTGNFAAPVNFTVGSNPESIVVEDFNEDGKLDLATSNRGSGDVSVLINNSIDVINGTEEDDFLEGTAEGEKIVGLAGSDFLAGNGGNDLIEGGEDFDFIEAGDGNDTVDGGNDDDLIAGDGGNDSMLASPGSDFFDGGTGTDLADYSQIGVAITFDAQTLVEKGTAGIDEIFDIETIIGAIDATNKIDGSTVVNDTNSLNVDLTTNTLAVDDGLEQKVYTIENFVNVTGTPLDDSIAGNEEDNTFLGKDGNDLFVGSWGNDKLDGGNGEDTVNYSNLDAAITFDAQTLVEKGANGVDEVLNLETIIGATGKANTIDGSTIVNDNNSFTVDLAANFLTVDDGSTSTTYTIENFLNVSGNSEVDSLIGDSGNNLLDGGAGSDRLNGRTGADTLIGVDAASATPGAGERDRLVGGADADVFVLGDTEHVFYLDEGGFFGRSGLAIILDFESGVDKIKLSGIADDYITRGSYIFADEGSQDGVLDRGDDMIAYVRRGFDAEDLMFV